MGPKHSVLLNACCTLRVLFHFCLLYSWLESDTERRGRGLGSAFQRVHKALCCETRQITLGNKHRHWVTASSQVSAGWLGYLALEFIQLRRL